ncbi:squamous cell carcinoma antigen recognized by T-cells 3-like [Limulus polyphemus]|uniref:Squamous cell carcinoma antigen recognized by T-cells 3-like n=1 Tax=Limulus polyphemus TaxID=6850 RepID=A0ABM1TJA5_LIMPO|nr:squamous cell carcinoma antigen recognized by T-cells 3-like [Limulus polyphemus]
MRSDTQVGKTTLHPEQILLFIKRFAPVEDLAVNWLTDESKLAKTEAERESVPKLFERTVCDYLSVPLWLEYAQFSIGCMGVKDGMENARSVFERAITAVGLHVTQGAMIWEAYREFENAILGTLQTSPGSLMRSGILRN